MAVAARIPASGHAVLVAGTLRAGGQRVVRPCSRSAVLVLDTGDEEHVDTVWAMHTVLSNELRKVTWRGLGRLSRWE